MIITDAAVTRLAHITEAERRELFKNNSKLIDFDAIVKKARLLETKKINNQLPEVGQPYDEVVGGAAMWGMKKKLPEAVKISL